MKISIKRHLNQHSAAMRPLPFFPANRPLAPPWGAYFERAGYQIQIYDPTQPPQNFDAILLLTPIRCADSWLSIENAWQKFFLNLEEKKHVRLIQAGIIGTESRPNYLHLYRLPDDFKEFLEQAQTVVDEWEPYPTSDDDLRERLRIFFDGNKDNGFSFWLENISIFLNFLPTNLPAAELRRELDDPEHHPQFDSIKARWQHYRPIFDCLPDQRFVKKIEQGLQNLKIEKILQADDTHLTKQIQATKQQIEAIRNALAPLRKLIPPPNIQL